MARKAKVPPPGDPSFWQRLRDARPGVAWKPAPKSRGRPGAPAKALARIARLHDEEARYEERTGAGRRSVIVSSGPVGALLLLLDVDDRGLPHSISALTAGTEPAFPDGAIEATWEEGSAPRQPKGVPMEELFTLARYAL